ncbi:MAG TPA: GAF and ANTAR domain-containing protein [Actinomycetes bacterium]|nr:GAF and ANTAR domain-containing protein [Actinomycetes bacterium]
MLPHGWTELVALLDQGPDVDPRTRVQRLCALAVQVTGVAGAALSVGSDGTRSTVCATDELSDMIEELQDTIGEGPSVESLRTGNSVLVADLAASDGRWPAFTPAATKAGVGGVFVFPLRMGAARLGVLALHVADVRPLDDNQFKDAWVLAEAATVLLMLSSPDGKPSEASAWVLGDRSRFRPEVHQAVGATMVHLDVGPRDAFARICAHAFATDTPIGVVAAEIVARKLRLEPG